MRTEPVEVHDRRFDVVVVGGGITGAALAREAAARGAVTLLVERGDFGSGASSRTRRVIEGGAHAFMAGRADEVRAALAERELLLRNAPHLVRPLPLLWPCRDEAPTSLLGGERGLRRYASMARRSTLPAPCAVDVGGSTRLFPGIETSGLRGGVLFYEAAANDTRLTLAVLEAARRAGAVLCNHLTLTGHRGASLQLVDEVAGGEVEVRAGRVFNAAGADADEVRRRLGAGEGAELVAVHDRAMLLLDPVDTEVGLVGPADDGAVQAVVPHHDGLLCAGRGGDAEAVRRGLARWLKSPPEADEVRVTVIAREAAAGGGARDVTESSPVGDVTTLVGADLTTHRARAEAALQGLVAGAASTVTQRLPGGDGPRDIGDPLWWRHGSRAHDVRSLGAGDRGALEPVCPHRPFVSAEVAFALQSEGAVTFEDVALRRLVDARGPCSEDPCLRRLHELYARACPAGVTPDFEQDRQRLLTASR